MLSLIGSLLGFGTSFLPKLLGYFEEKRDQAHELAVMDKQIEAQERVAAVKLQMVNVEADIRETESLHQEHASITRKAAQWVINLSATVRPVMTYLLFFEFIALTWLLAGGYIDNDMYSLVWNNEMQAIWAAVVSFWFGSRSFNRKGHS